MNSKNTHKFKALLALFLSISMLFSMVVTSFAAIELSEGDVTIKDVNDDNTIHYIAFGDSVTNGFGLAGYTYPIPNSADKNSPNGFQVDTITAYPNLIREALANYYGEDYTVTYEPLAISGMRLGDLRMILTSAYETKEEGRYDGDYYRHTWWDNELWENDVEEWLEREYYMFNANPKETTEDNYTKYTTGTNGSKYVEYYKGTVGTQSWIELKNTRDLLYDEYKNEIENADVMSIDLGTNDFGTFLTSRLQMLVGMDEDYANVFDPNLPQIDFTIFLEDEDAAALKAVFENLVDQFMPVSDQSTAFMNAVITDLSETLVYGLMAFACNFDASMEEIYKLNPDIQVMVIDCYNMMAGTTFEGLEVFGGVDILEVYDTFVDIANLYTRSLSPWASRLVHVDLGKVGSEDYPVLFLEYFEDFDESVTVNGVELVGWDAFTQRQYEKLLEDGYEEDEAWELAEFYTNEAKESVERFAMDAMGIRDEYGAWAPTKKGIDTLDEIVYNFPEFIDEYILDNVVSGVGTAVEAVDTAIAGCDLILTAVDGVALIGEAVNGVAIADGLVDLFTKDLNTLTGSNISLFGSNTLPQIAINYPSLKSTVLGYIVDYIEGSEYASVLAEYNMSSDAAAELVWQAAVKYGSAPDEASARKAAVTFVIIEFYTAAGKTVNGEPLDQELADKVYDVVSVYNTTDGGEKEKTVAALTEYLDGDSAYANLAWLVADAYNSVEGDSKASMAAALKAYLDANAEDKTVDNTATAALGAELYFMHKNGTSKADLVVFAVQSALGVSDTVAKALYNVYSGEIQTTDIVTIINNVTTLAGIPAEKAAFLVDADDEIAEFYLNNDEYSGRYKNELVKSVALALMQFNGSDFSAAYQSYVMYSMYSGIAETFSSVAEINTIYLDSLLGAIASGGMDPASIVSKYFDPTADGWEPGKQLTVPNVNSATYEQDKLDCSFLVMYIRMLSLDGLFMHPGTEGQSTFGRLVAEALDEFVPNVAAGDEVFELEEGKVYKVLSLGNTDYLLVDGQDPDFWGPAGSAPSYDNLVAKALNGEDGRGADVSTVGQNTIVGEVLDILTSPGSPLESDPDLILLNVGAWNIGYIARYISDPSNTPIDLTDIGILNASQSVMVDDDGEFVLVDGEKQLDPETSIGERFESLLSGDDMMLMAKALMYGYADFADNIEPLVEALLETGATVVLVGLDDLMSEGSTITLGTGLSFNLDLLIEKLTSDFNGHMRVIADKYENCYFADISGVSNDWSASSTVTICPDADTGEMQVYGMTQMMRETIFDENEHAKIAQRILCDTLGIHVPSEEIDEKIEPTCQTLGEIHYNGACACGASGDDYVRYLDKVGHSYDYEKPEFDWAEDYESAKVEFKCEWCDSVDEYDAEVTSENSATCTEAGKITYTAIATVNGTEYKEVKEFDSDAIKHAYGEPEWAWTGDKDNGYTKAVATFVCANDEKHVETVETTEFSIKEITKPTCTGVGENEYTAKVVFNEKEYSKTAPTYVVVDMIAHVYDKPVWNWSDDYSEATATFDCTACDDVQVVEAKVESETTDSTCKVEGKVVYIATAVFGDDEEEFTDSKTVTLELGDHDYVDDICSVCGTKDPNARPDESGDCVYVTEESLDADGVYTLTLGGEEVGEFDFVAVDGGWTIADENGDYIAIVDGELVCGSDAFVWTFENGMFSAEETIVKEVASGGFWGGLFGGETEPEEITTKYYLAAYDGDLVLAENGEEAEFSVEHHDNKHSYDDGVVTKPTCEDKGYTTYTCEKCGEECVYNEKDPVDHKYVDGECEYCGKEEDSEDEPEEPEVPEEPVEDCIYVKEVELEEDGSYIVSIGGWDVGKYTVTAVDDGWTILDESDGTYLAVANGILVYTDEEFVWTYEDGKFFYEDVQTVTSTGGFWGGLFGGSGATETVVTVYYIVPEEDKLAVSEDGELAEVIFEIIVVEEGHDYVDGVCDNCGAGDDFCVSFEAVELEEDGEYVLIINDEHLGFHTFENVGEDLWTIVNEDGNYVALEDGEIVYTDEEFVWTYDSEKSVFSAEIETVATGGFWGGLFGGNGSATVKTYYLSAEDGNLVASAKKNAAKAEFLVEIVGEHVYGDMEDYYGFDRSFCENCGTQKIEIAE